MSRYITYSAGDYEHVRIAERALGKRLPKEARVHHIDYDGKNNRPDNLVVCPNEAYHKLLHIRTYARNACGNVNWCKCTHCQQYDDPANMKKLPSLSESYYHRACDSARRTAYNKAKKVYNNWNKT